jgi:hypothetical protein
VDASLRRDFMSNNLSSKTLYGDSVGFLSKKRVNIVGLTWVPNTAGDALTLSFFEENEIQVAKKSSLVTITSSSIITSVPTGGNVFPNTFRAGDAILVGPMGGQAKPQNEGLHLITTAGDNDHLHTEADLTDVTEIPMTLVSLTRKTFQIMYSAAKDTLQFHFDKDTWLPNLAITSIANSGIVLVQIA